MKLFILLAVIIAFFSTLVNATTIPYHEMSDFEIARMFIDNETVYSNVGAITYPKVEETWYVGELVNVTFNTKGREGQTVSIFFFNQTPNLAGGPLTKKVFPFVVPASAVSPPGQTSLLLAVRRENLYLQTVDSIIVKVLPGKPPHA